MSSPTQEYALADWEKARLETCVQELENARKKESYSFMAYWTRQIDEILKPHQEADRKKTA